MKQEQKPRGLNGSIRPRTSHQAHQDAHESASAPLLYARSLSASMKIYIDTPQGRKTAGKLVSADTEPVFEKRVSEAKHLYRRYNAWAIDASCLEQLPKFGVSRIRLVVTDKDWTEETTVEAFAAHGQEFNDGYGPQVRLARKYFTRLDPSQQTLFGGDA